MYAFLLVCNCDLPKLNALIFMPALFLCIIPFSYSFIHSFIHTLFHSFFRTPLVGSYPSSLGMLSLRPPRMRGGARWQVLGCQPCRWGGRISYILILSMLTSHVLYCTAPIRYSNSLLMCWSSAPVLILRFILCLFAYVRSSMVILLFIIAVWTGPALTFKHSFAGEQMSIIKTA